ncbi:hypothetical protein [Sphingomicrobium sediminis]|uniref:Lipoprotein n=1 Tax=Sphingomicrobium sediminis TaxID=2950949 RepID=A0A9X2J2N8_9SPHN|nr:hypothetical protein [Sphingomicrobium sediminis]MCM8557964.1 hypothetical protein [Sphingomicrobium sediminis]
MRIKLIIPAAALLVAPACAPVDPGFGETVTYAQAAQMVNPDPVYDEDDAKPGADGNKAAAAAERYRTDSVKQPARQTSSTPQ